MRTVLAVVALVVAGVAVAAPIPKLPSSGFTVYSVDGKGGGWVIHKLVGRGDTLWGCADVASVQGCKQVMFEEWRPAATLKFLHINKSTQDAWLRLSAPGLGDFLYACGKPEGEPTCQRIDLEMRMKPMPSLERVWPPYACVSACGEGGAALSPDDPRLVIEDASHSEIWVELGLKTPGPSNLYACRGLGKDPVCQLAVPNWLVLDREDIGVGKFVDVVVTNPDGTKSTGPGVLVDKVDEASVAWTAGLRNGMKIVKIGGFEVNDNVHARAMVAQYPAERPIPVTLADGQVLEIVPRRKQPKKK